MFLSQLSLRRSRVYAKTNRVAKLQKSERGLELEEVAHPRREGRLSEGNLGVLTWQ